LGGLETLVSYRVPPEILANRDQIVEVNAAFHDALPKPHLRFFRDLQKSFVGDFFFAHAGVKPKV
jgi:serine/threonine protein phosphatase 1